MKIGKDGIPTYNRQDMVKVIAKGAGITNPQAQEVLESILAHIKQAVIDRKETVFIPGFTKIEARPVVSKYVLRKDGTYAFYQTRAKLRVMLPGRYQGRMYAALYR